VAYLLSIGIALTSVLLIGLALSLSIIESIVWAFAAATVAGGTLFTVLEMRKLSRVSK
jgi:ABC-type nickel/cobalt efflux system permease component RcnA